MTHSRLAEEKCSARWTDGSAMFTIDASSTTISWAVAMTSNASPLWRCWGAPASAGRCVAPWCVAPAVALSSTVMRPPGASCTWYSSAQLVVLGPTRRAVPVRHIRVHPSDDLEVAAHLLEPLDQRVAF